jgi:hypothetical protein
MSLPRPHRNWKKRLRKAWSVKLMIAGAAITGLQAMLPMVDLTFLPQWAYLGIMACLFVAAPVAVALKQGELDDDD